MIFTLPTLITVIILKKFIDLLRVFTLWYCRTFIHTHTATISLPRKSDADRKVEIVQYARCTRALVIRLLALVKWAGSSNSVQKCSVCR